MSKLTRFIIKMMFVVLISKTWNYGLHNVSHNSEEENIAMHDANQNSEYSYITKKLNSSGYFPF